MLENETGDGISNNATKNTNFVTFELLRRINIMATRAGDGHWFGWTLEVSDMVFPYCQIELTGSGFSLQPEASGVLPEA